MIKAEAGRGRGVKVIAAGSALEMVGDVLSIFGEKRATEFLEKFRETFEAYASLCLENAKGDANMDYTKGCIDRELARIMGSAFQPWEVRYPEKVFGGK